MTVLHPQRRQGGVALITALLITALVTVVAVAMASRQQLDIRRTGNQLESDQAYVYALSVESFAAKVLAEDAKKTQIDALTEVWATTGVAAPLEGGSVQGALEDLQGRFNLNDLVDASGKADPAQIKMLQELMARVDATDDKLTFSPFLANAVTDWIDTDLNSLAAGAEDLEYLNLQPPYRTANRFMANPSELRAVAGFDSNMVRALTPLVATLPEATKINVNTAPELVLMSLHQDITPQIAKELDELRKQEPFERVDDFVNRLKADHNITVDKKYLDVKSGYFLLDTVAKIGRTEVELYSVLQRKGNQVVTIQRSIGVY
jgi:general secretion pathway protein K